MKNTLLLKILWLIAGSLLIIAGIYAFINPPKTLATVSIILGSIMAINGIINIVIYLKWHHHFSGLIATLAEGIMTIILGLLLIFNDKITASILAITFSLWIICMGGLRVVHAIKNQKTEKSWTYTLAIGIISITVGIISLFFQGIVSTTISYIIGTICVVQGFSTLWNLIPIRRVKK